MAVDEGRLKKIGEDFSDIAGLISLEWRYRASAEGEATYEYIRSRPLLSKSYQIDRGSIRTTYRLHGFGNTNKEGLAEVYLTDFMRSDDFQPNEPNSAVFVAIASGDQPIVLSHSIETKEIDVGSPGHVATLYTATVRSWGLDGKPAATQFSWHATVDTSTDPAVGGG